MEETIEFNGKVFERVEQGYYRRFKEDRSGVGYLHREIYEFYSGKTIPDGFHVHHKDFDKSNNDFSNLECIEEAKHMSLHSKLYHKEHKEECKKHLDEIRPLTVEWHGSAEGYKWHSEHAKRVFNSLHEKDFICEVCGKLFKSTQNRSRFCSNNCKSKFRRDSKVDNVKRRCHYCGNTFEIDKYSKTICCTKNCAGKFRRRKSLQSNS